MRFPDPARQPPGPEVEGGLGGGHAPQRRLGWARSPGNILVFKIFRMLFGKPGCYILNILVGATACLKPFLPISFAIQCSHLSSALPVAL